MNRPYGATEPGASRPTVGEAMRRLTEAGPVGSYYALSDGIGTAVAISIAPEGVVAERVDAHGETVSRVEVKIDEPARPAQVATALCDAVHGPAPLARGGERRRPGGPPACGRHRRDLSHRLT